MTRKLLVTALISLVSSTLAMAQVVREPELGIRLIDLPTHLVLPFGTLQVLFTHRFTEAATTGTSGDLYGLDSAADIGIGLALGLGHGLDAEVYRSTLFKQIETAVKWTALRQGSSFPLGVGLRLGSEFRVISGVKDRWAGFAQMVIARRLGSRLDLFAVPMYASDTPTLRNAVNVGLGASVHLPHAWDISLEGVPGNGDVPGSTTAWAVGLVKRIPGHSFLIYLGNSRATTADLIAGSDLPGGFKAGDVRLGFNLVRRFPE
jgi:Membrane bound beta barrel domain (DUF5777)